MRRNSFDSWTDYFCQTYAAYLYRHHKPWSKAFTNAVNKYGDNIRWVDWYKSLPYAMLDSDERRTTCRRKVR